MQLELILSNAILSGVAAVLLIKNDNWHLRSVLILILCSNLDSIARNTIFAGAEAILPYLHRANTWLNIGIGYFVFLMVHDAYQDAFGFLRRHRLAFIRYLTIIYALILLYFLTQDNFLVSMISYGLPVILMFILGFFARPPRWQLILGSAIIIGASAYLSLAEPGAQGMMKPGDIYHYGLAVGLIIFHRAYNAEYHT